MTTVTRSVLLALAAFELILGMKPAWGKAGSLDPTFGQNGVTVTSFAKLSFVIPYSIKLQTDGKILVLVATGGEQRGY